MAGYRITYDGSNVDRRDVPQMTTGSSLSGVTTFSPTSWENPSPGDPFGDFNPRGPAEVLPNTYNASIYASASPGVVTNTGTTVTLNGIYYWSASTANLPVGTYNWEYRIRSTGGATFPDIQAWVSDTTGTRTSTSGRSGTLLYSTTFPNDGAYYVFSGTATITNPNQWILFDFGFSLSNYDRFFELDYLRITQSNTVTISESTLTQGVAPTGTTGVIETVSTDINGGNSVGPAKEFGVVAKHDGQEVVEATYLPSAESAEDARASVTSEKIITATDTSVTVEAFGLGGAERLEGGDTRIIVEDIEDTTENP